MRERLAEVELPRLRQCADHHRIEARVAHEALGDGDRIRIVAANRNRDARRLTVGLPGQRRGRNAVESPYDAVVLQELGRRYAGALALPLGDLRAIAPLAPIQSSHVSTSFQALKGRGSSVILRLN